MEKELSTTILKNPQGTFELSFNQKAIQTLKQIAKDEKDPHKKIRIGVKGGGCTGLSYVLEMAPKEDTDEVYDLEGFVIVINPMHKIYLNGMHVAYDDGLNARGFTFKNPNATKTCGCGSSFAV